MRGKKHSEIFYPQSFYIWRYIILAYLERDGKYLMMRRSREDGIPDKTQLTGVFGHKKKKKFVVDEMMRKVQEIAGVTPTKWRYRGMLECHYETDPVNLRYLERIFLFNVTDWEGEITFENPEGTLQWIDKDEVRQYDLWRGDRVFLKVMDDNMKFFSLMLDYDQEDKLEDAVLNLKRVPVEDWDLL